jgi:hypothetical protein
MFVAGEECLDVGFGAARARLSNLVRAGALITPSAECYEQGMTGLARVARWARYRACPSWSRSSSASW